MKGRSNWCAVASTLLLAGCAATDPQPNSWRVVAEQAIAPYAVHLDCLDMAPGERIDYAWESTRPVSFDLRYRSGGGIVMPISRDRATRDAGVFAATLAQQYCLAWEARGDGALVSYRLRLRPGDE